MSAAYPAAIQLEVKLGSTWQDVAAYQVGTYTGRDGFGRTGFMDRVASQGSLSFKLNNLAGLFTYLGQTQMAGWRATLPLRLNILFDNAVVNVFTGRTDDLQAKTKFPAWLDVTAYDWLAALSKFELDKQAILADRTVDDAIRVLLTHLPWQPANLDLHPGANIFPTVFDSVGRKGTPAGEIAKLVNSELGYVYMRRNETLVLEAMGERARLLPTLSTEKVALGDELSPAMLFEDGAPALFEDGAPILFNEVRPAAFLNAADNIPVITELCAGILFEDGAPMLFEDGAPAVFNDVEEAIFYDDEYLDMDVADGPNHFNAADITAYPRYTDDEPVRLYRLGSPIALPANTPVKLKGSWTNPTSGDAIGGLDVDTPAESTNFTVNSAQDGTGSDLTSQLVVEEWNAYGNGFDAVVRSPAGGWLMTWEINGLGIYTSDQATAELEETAAIERDGENSLPVDLPYLNDFAFSKGLVAAEMLYQRDKKREGKRIHLLANKSPKLMMAFLYLQTGSVIRVVDTRHEIDHFYSLFDREYSITAGIINYSWGVKRLLSQRDMTEVELQFAISSSTVQDAVALGVLPNWASRRITFFCEVFVSSVGSAATLMSLPYLAGGQETFLRLQVNSAGALLARTSQFEEAGTWTSTGDAVDSGAWVPASLSYDSGSLANVPRFFIGGALQSVTSPTQPSGARKANEPLTFLEIGGHMKEQSSASYDIRVRRHRWFNDVLSDAEHEALAANPEDYSLFADRLLMGGYSVPNEYFAEWQDAELGEDVKVIDLVSGSANTEVGGAPTIRALS